MRKTTRRQRDQAITQVEGFQQRSLFDHTQMARLKKRRRLRKREENR